MENTMFNKAFSVFPLSESNSFWICCISHVIVQLYEAAGSALALERTEAQECNEWFITVYFKTNQFISVYRE